MHDIVYEFRPEEVLGQHANTPLLRYNNGLWTKDDGEFDLAFIADPELANDGYGWYVYFKLPVKTNITWSWMKENFNPLHKDPDYNRWHHMLKEGCNDEGENIKDPSWSSTGIEFTHPNHVAYLSAEKRRKELDTIGSNSRYVSLNIYDSTIQRGLLRNAETHEIIKPPSILRCHKCGVDIPFDYDTWNEVNPIPNQKDISKQADKIRKEMDKLYNLINPTRRLISKEIYKEFEDITTFLNIMI